MLVLSVSSCSPSSRDTQSRLARAESLMQEHPDSALSIIESIDASTIHSRSLKASYALRYSQALDKNAIFLTSDSILIPAIDYYSENGSTQEKMLTMYYHGRIFMNAGNYSQAIISFIEAAQLAIDINSK